MNTSSFPSDESNSRYDGQRAQIHLTSSRQVHIFSRHLEMMTNKYPDLVILIPRIKKEGVRNFIMEGEVVAVDEQGQVKPFQMLSSRGRNITGVHQVKVRVCLYAFDLMYLNDTVLSFLGSADGRVYWINHFDREENY